MKGRSRQIVLAAAVAVAIGAAVWWLVRLPAGPGTGAVAPPNVVLVTIDTLRADRVGAGLTPALDRLASSGVVFTKARAAAALTLPSHASLLTGTRPPVHGIRENGTPSLASGVVTLAEYFRGRGYRTAAFVSAYVLDRRFGLDRGFETYDDRIRRDPEATTRLEAERPGAETIGAAIAWLQALRRDEAARTAPFFLWVHVYEPHAPYGPAPAFLARAGGDPYGGEVAAADAAVGLLLEAVAAQSTTDDAVVAVTSDHGESLGDHGEATHGMLLYDPVLRVPLVIAAPGRWPPGRRTEAVSLVDVAPTLIGFAGGSAPPSMTGADLRRAAGPGETYSETEYPKAAGWSPLAALVDDRWKLVLSSEAELFDLDADAGEASNLAASKPTVVQAMRSRLEELRRVSAEARTRVSSPESIERLRALGYVAGPSQRPDALANAPNPARVISAWSRFEKALTDLSSGRPIDAARVLDALVREHPEAPVFHTTRARALLDAGDAVRALAAYRTAARRWPSDPVLLHDLAVAAREAGAGAEAEAVELAAIQLDANHPAAFNGLGLVRADAGRWAEAAEAFGRAVELDATNGSYWVNLGNVRRERREWPGAERAYRQALDLDPNHADASNGLGVLLVEAGKPAEAIAWFERALSAAPAFHEARLNLGIAYEQTGQTTKAIAALRQVLQAPAQFSRERRAAAAVLKSLSAQR